MNDLVVLTAAWPSPRAPAVGGFIRNFTAACARQGLESRVVAPRTAAVRGGFISPMGRPKLRTQTPMLGLLYLLSAYRACVRECLARRPQGLLVHWILPGGPAALWAARRCGVPLFAWAHGSDLEVYAARSRMFRALARRVVRAASLVCAVSASLATRARALGARHVIDLSMGIDTTFRSPLPPGERAGPFTVLFVGDLIVQKGVRTLLAAHRLLGTARNIRLVCVGRGPLAAEARAQGVEVRSDLNAAGVCDVLDRSHVLVLPSRSEGTPLSVMEALARGVPVVATRVGGIPHLVTDGREGLLIAPPVRPRTLAMHMGRLHDDRTLWAELAAGAWRRGKDLPSCDDIARRFRAALVECKGHGRHE